MTENTHPGGKSVKFTGMQCAVGEDAPDRKPLTRHPTTELLRRALVQRCRYSHSPGPTVGDPLYVPVGVWLFFGEGAESVPGPVFGFVLIQCEPFLVLLFSFIIGLPRAAVNEWDVYVALPGCFRARWGQPNGDA